MQYIALEFPQPGDMVEVTQFIKLDSADEVVVCQLKVMGFCTK